MFRGRAQRIYFVGLGGIGMSGIAEVLLTLGYDVGGSDLHLTAITARLEHLGATVFEGHKAENVHGSDVVVTSSAVHAANPEVVEARRLGIPVIRRAEMLAELMRLKYGIAVAGSHGKTTTTSLIGTVLAEAGMDPTLVVGGRLKAMDSNARLGAGEYLVAEADESDGSFLRLMPTIAIVTNIDPEHLDHWQGGLPQLIDGFAAFVERVPFYGAAVLCVDHPNVRALLPRLDKRVITYGLSTPADYTADNVRVGEGVVRFRALRRGESVGDVQLSMIGRHNVLNALATLAVADEVGVRFAAYARALASFAGIGRRFELKGEAQGVRVVDDYGHHPAEIQATLSAAREAYARRLVVAFQPHRYTRTRDLLTEFAAAFDACDVLVVSDIYAAGEAPIAGIHSRALVEAVQRHGHKDVRYVPDRREVASVLRGIVRSGDLVLTLGAGNLWQAGEELLVYLREQDVTA